MTAYLSFYEWSQHQWKSCRSILDHKKIGTDLVFKISLANWQRFCFWYKIKVRIPHVSRNISYCDLFFRLNKFHGCDIFRFLHNCAERVLQILVCARYTGEKNCSMSMFEYQLQFSHKLIQSLAFIKNLLTLSVANLRHLHRMLGGELIHGIFAIKSVTFWPVDTHMFSFCFGLAILRGSSW